MRTSQRKDRRQQQDLLNLLDRMADRKIVLLGDMVLDQFIYGESSRISREAPVLILSHRRTIDVPGSGANAVYNLHALSAQVIPIGCIGRDAGGHSLVRLFAEAGIPTSGLLSWPDSHTTTKTRILGGLEHAPSQQIVRLDREWPVQLCGARLRRLLQSLRRALQDSHGAIISDYGYGIACQPAIDLLRRHCSERNIPLVVDSRFRLAHYPGITALTPNITEVEAAVGRTIGCQLDLLEHCSRKLMETQQLSALLVTRGRFGMCLLEPGRPMLTIPVHGTDQVADVTGAGDTVIATFTLALSAGASFAQAARLANYAGGIVVMKRGTATVNRDELRQAVLSES